MRAHDTTSDGPREQVEPPRGERRGGHNGEGRDAEDRTPGDEPARRQRGPRTSWQDTQTQGSGRRPHHLHHLDLPSWERNTKGGQTTVFPTGEVVPWGMGPGGEDLRTLVLRPARFLY